MGRFENKPLNERKCPFCYSVESEEHVLLDCALYDDFRSELFNKALVIEPNFFTLQRENKIAFLFSNQSMIRAVAKTCFNILQRTPSNNTVGLSRVHLLVGPFPITGGHGSGQWYQSE